MVIVSAGYVTRNMDTILDTMEVYAFCYGLTYMAIAMNTNNKSEVHIMETLADRVVACKTRRFEGDDAVMTSLTLDFSGVTKDDLVEYAIDALVIKWQSSIRRKKDVTVPKTATYKVPKPGVRAAATLTPFEMLAGLFGKDRALAMVNKAGSVEKVIEMLGIVTEEVEE